MTLAEIAFALFFVFIIAQICYRIFSPSANGFRQKDQLDSAAVKERDIAKHGYSALQTMNERRKKGELCDFVIKVGEESLKIHRLVLDTVSPYFCRMFQTKMIEAQQSFYELHDVPAHAVKACIDLMYTGQFELSKTTVADVLKVSHMWQLDKGVEKCGEFLKQNLDLSSCIESKNLSSLYELQDLGIQCNEFILDNLLRVFDLDCLARLDIEKIFDLLKMSVTRNVLPEDLWRFCVKWSEKTQKHDRKHRFLCLVVPEFPMEKFHVTGFREHPWENPHVQLCKNCKNQAAKKFLSGLETKNLSELKPEVYLFLKKISKTYENRSLEKLADEYILKNHVKVFQCPAFVEIGKEDFLKYLNQINEKCSADEFTAIVAWLKRDETRHDAFRGIFEFREEQQSGVFLTSLQDVRNLTIQKSRKSIPWASGGLVPKDSWWVKDCFFMKSLAQKYDCKNMEAKLDECIARDFSKTSKLDGFKVLPIAEVVKYLMDPKLYNSGEEVVWNAVKLWIEHDTEYRAGEFPQLFEAMLLDKFSTKFLREQVVNSPLVMESNSSMNHLMTIILQRAQ